MHSYVGFEIEAVKLRVHVVGFDPIVEIEAVELWVHMLALK